MSIEKIDSNKNCVEEFEDAYHSVVKYLEQLDEKRAGIDEIKKDTDILVERFIDSARTCEQFFLQKHLQIADAKPEQVLMEECTELRTEINKKDVAIAKHHEKLKKWQADLRPTVPTGKSSQNKGAPVSYTVQGQPLLPP